MQDAHMILVIIITGIVCAIIHKKKGYSLFTGFLWGFFFSVVGLGIVLSERTKEEQEKEDEGHLTVLQLLGLFLLVGTLLIAGLFLIA